MLGRRPSQHYGTFSLYDLERMVREWGAERGMRVGCFQSDHEGAFLEHVHGLAGIVDGAIVNPGAWTHYQWSIRDALEAMGAPFVEVHISDVEERAKTEPHRGVSVVRDIAMAAVWGKGPDGYREAVDLLAERLA
ncbi:MAG: 3-dehydroquinate dehydratase [Actinobacteria bacterium]|nr:3-dehydroquinate dehydratase [Thermoleophilia bacterium]MCB9012261.1 3-dehydroquinate dehydratase [Actinomycetota bacterium]